MQERYHTSGIAGAVAIHPELSGNGDLLWEGRFDCLFMTIILPEMDLLPAAKPTSARDTAVG